MQIKKIILAISIIIVMILIFLFDLHNYLTLENLKSSKEKLNFYYQENPLLVLVTYFGIYLASAAFSIPGALILSLAGGALFGLTLGTLVVSFASTIGATLAMLISRYLLGDLVKKRFALQMMKINSGMLKEGAFYLFTLRLLPAVPFFAINLAMGLTRLRTLTFFWVSQLGMLPATLVYVNAGSELGEIQVIDDILSPSLIISFVLLGIFPLLIKNILTTIQAKNT
ncbi:MAG: TVP38/TMEM64 family protein [Deltaproteobacteria bacterium]|nr:TVP38/TMEM64 family protein [Deltaproteobacteria bacterium]|tara:strand:- start:1242 stop:1922 length:681 start_codon:yes stop_codon:yes gene_type:complete